MKLIRATVTILVALTLVVGIAPASAWAATGCSSSKKVPGVSIYYNYCDQLFSVSSASRTKWNATANVQDNHDSAVQIDTQMTLRIDGVDAFTKTWSFYPDGQYTMVDPYNGYNGAGLLNSCTAGHTYFPIVRMRVHNGTWGLDAGAGQFVCPS